MNRTAADAATDLLTVVMGAELAELPEPSSAVIRRGASGSWYVSLQVDAGIEEWESRFGSPATYLEGETHVHRTTSGDMYGIDVLVAQTDRVAAVSA